MKASQHSLTLVELIFVVVVVFVALGFLLPWLARAHEEARKDNCRATLKLLGKAMAAYRADNGGYFPFSWQRAGDAEPEENGAANGAMAATSLGNLYPRYVKDCKLFHCPSTEDHPSFVLNLPLEYRGLGQTTGPSVALPQGSNWTLTGNVPLRVWNGPTRACSYAYDPRISPRGLGKLAVAGDMDGDFGVGKPDTYTNHDCFQHVLYVDGHVALQTGNFCSADPNDNIFVEDKWDADTDSYLVDTDAALSVSFEGYKHLHYSQKAKP